MVGNRAKCIQHVGGRSSNCDCRFRNCVDATSVLLSGGLEQQIRATGARPVQAEGHQAWMAISTPIFGKPAHACPRLGLTVDRGLCVSRPLMPHESPRTTGENQPSPEMHKRIWVEDRLSLPPQKQNSLSMTPVCSGKNVKKKPAEAGCLGIAEIRSACGDRIQVRQGQDPRGRAIQVQECWWLA